MLVIIFLLIIWILTLDIFRPPFQVNNWIQDPKTPSSPTIAGPYCASNRSHVLKYYKPI